MMRKYIFILLLFWSFNGWADTTIAFDKAPIDQNDIASIKRGGTFFSKVCMNCHTLIYLRYNTLAKEVGVLYDKMPVNVKWPAGAVPPDLSVEANIRGVDWLYTYLHSFYEDKSRPTGLNNLLVPNSNMPGILVPFQGTQVLAKDLDLSKKLYSHNWQWYDALVLTKEGSMTPAEFDATIIDVVNFLAYAAEPFQREQHRIGYGVIAFLLFFFILVYLLKREYWKDVK